MRIASASRITFVKLDFHKALMCNGRLFAEKHLTVYRIFTERYYLTIAFCIKNFAFLNMKFLSVSSSMEIEYVFIDK